MGVNGIEYYRVVVNYIIYPFYFFLFVVNIIMTHSELVKRGEKWLYNHGCDVVLTELSTTANEIPDVIGWNTGGSSTYIECKVTRSDFLADKRKSPRRVPEMQMGNLRYYLCPKNIIQPQDLPVNWGLLWCYPTLIRVITKPVWYNLTEFSTREEYKMLITALKRVRIKGALPIIYTDIDTDVRDFVEGLE